MSDEIALGMKLVAGGAMIIYSFDGLNGAMRYIVLGLAAIMLFDAGYQRYLKWRIDSCERDVRTLEK